MEIKKTLVPCPTKDEAGRLQELLEKEGFPVVESYRELWDIYRTRTVFEVNGKDCKFLFEGYYENKEEYNDWTWITVCSLESKIKRNRIFRSIRKTFGSILVMLLFTTAAWAIWSFLALLPKVASIIVAISGMAVSLFCLNYFSSKE